MLRATSSSSSSPSSSSSHPTNHKRKHRYTREHLLKSLEILGTINPPLPPELPPSPPASRSNSPAPSSKRRHPPEFEQGNSKRPRLSVSSEHRHQSSSIPPLPASSSSSAQARYPSRSDPAEDGEVREDPLPPSARDAFTPISPYLPVRRPRRGHRLNIPQYDDIHSKYHNYGRMLKYSGDTRMWSTFPSKNKEYRPLLNPPHPSSPYHKYGNLFARLELLDSLLCFTYSIWIKDYSRKQCFRTTWTTIEGFLVWCKAKWNLEEGLDDREKAFLGLIQMIEAYIHGRRIHFAAKGIDIDNEKYLSKLNAMADREEAQKREAEAAAAMRADSNAVQMLPSPESINAGSANSTPTPSHNGSVHQPNSSNNNTNNNNNSGNPNRPPTMPPQPSSQPHRSAPGNPKEPRVPPPKFTLPVNGPWVYSRKLQSGGLTAASFVMTESQKTLNLPIMAKHFPRTFTRMIHSSLSATDEHEPEFEDEEGELFWPGQLVTGEGIGWVCLMGKAMIREFGKEYGYLGIEGVIPKPKPEEQGVEGAPPPMAGETPPAASSSAMLMAPGEIGGSGEQR